MEPETRGDRRASPGAAPPEGFVPLALARCGEDAYARSAAQLRHGELWWYVGGLVRRGTTRPFRDSAGRWWYAIKPGFIWPVNFFANLPPDAASLGWRPLLGAQWPVEPQHADSRVWMNVARDIAGYDLSRVDADKRRAVRKGLRGLSIAPGNPADPQFAAEARDVWNSHVERTGWNRRYEAAEFTASWRELAQMPGTTVLAARDRISGVLCAWLIVRVIDDVAYMDTLASHTERLDNRPNDAIVYAAVASAAAAGVRHAHYSLRSSVTSLEAFKRSLGFEPIAFPTRLALRWMVRRMLAWKKPHLLRRLEGDENWHVPQSGGAAPYTGAVPSAGDARGGAAPPTGDPRGATAPSSADVPRGAAPSTSATDVERPASPDSSR